MFIEIGLIAVFFMLIVQGGIMVFWAGNMNSRVKTLEDKVASVASLPERLARLETVTQTLVQTSQQTAQNVEAMKTYILAHDGTPKHLKQMVEGVK